MTEPPSWSVPSGDEPPPIPPPPPPPQYGAPQYGAPQYGAPQYGAPQYGAPQYGAPQYPPPYQPAYPGYQQPYAMAAPKPGIIPLRPLAVGEILDGAFATIRRHPKAVLGVSAAMACVQQAMVLLARFASGTLTHAQSVNFSANDSSSQDNLAGIYGGLGGTLLITALVGALLTGMLCLIVSDSILGQPTSVRSAWVRLRPLVWRLVVVSVAATVAEVVGLAFCIAPGVYLWGIWALVVPALVLERTTIGGAFSRSMHLVKGSFWRVWGIRALGYLIAGVLNGILGAVAGASSLHDIFSSSANGGDIHISTFTIVLGAVLGVVGTTLTAPFLAGVLTLLYVDRRIRVEALDVQLQQTAAAAATTFG